MAGGDVQKRLQLVTFYDEIFLPRKYLVHIGISFSYEIEDIVQMKRRLPTELRNFDRSTISSLYLKG